MKLPHFEYIGFFSDQHRLMFSAMSRIDSGSVRCYSLYRTVVSTSQGLYLLRNGQDPTNSSNVAA